MILQYFSIKVMYVQNLLNLKFPLSFCLIFCKKADLPTPLNLSAKPFYADYSVSS